MSMDDTGFEFAEITPNAEEALISAENLAAITTIINALPKKCRMVFKLIKEDGLKYQEAADVLNLSIKTIEGHMTHAMRKIGELLQKNAQEQSEKSARNY